MMNTPKVRNFVLHTLKNKFVSKKTQPFYNGFGYYLMVWHLRDSGVLKEDSIGKNREKKWVLTEKGLKLGKLFQKLDDIMKKIEEAGK